MYTICLVPISYFPIIYECIHLPTCQYLQSTHCANIVFHTHLMLAFNSLLAELIDNYTPGQERFSPKPTGVQFRAKISRSVINERHGSYLFDVWCYLRNHSDQPVPNMYDSSFTSAFAALNRSLGNSLVHASRVSRIYGQ